MIVLWIFGTVLFIWAIDEIHNQVNPFSNDDPTNGTAQFFTILIPAFLLFYTIGWAKQRRAK